MTLRMRRVREVMGKRQQEVSAATGIPNDWLSKVELGKVRHVDIERMRILAKYYGKTIDELLEKEK